MSSVLCPPGSSVGVELSDELVGRYRAQGWTDFEPGEPEKKYLSQQNKAELIVTANELGLDADDSLSKKDLLELIEAAQAEATPTDKAGTETEPVEQIEEDAEPVEAPVAESEQQ